MPTLVNTGLISSLTFAVLLVVTIPALAGYNPPPNQDPPNDSSGSSTSLKRNF